MSEIRQAGGTAEYTPAASGEPQAIATGALFLASDEALFVPGAFCVADGGLWARSGMPSLSGEGPDWSIAKTERAPL